MQSESVAALAAALAKAQGAIKPAPMDRDNPFFKSRYATLTALWEAARAALAANGLAVTQTTDMDDNGNVALITTLLHSSGEWIGGVYPVRPVENKPQSMGSAITYARRYAFAAILGLVSDDDDDGNAANGNTGGASRQNNSNGGAATVKRQPAPAAAPAPSAEHDNPFDNPPAEDDAAYTRKLNAIGAELYRDKWSDDKRHELAGKFSKGRVKSSLMLTPQERENLIAWMRDRIDERQQAATQQQAVAA